MCDVLSTETYICRLNASPVPQPAASLKQSFVQLDTGTQDYHCVKMSTTILKIAFLSFFYRCRPPSSSQTPLLIPGSKIL